MKHAVAAMAYSIDTKLTPEDDAFLRARLDEFNAPFAGAKKFEEFDFTLRDEDGEIVAGVVASCVYDWLHINVIWVSEQLRGQGFGDKLLEQAEQEGIKRGRKYAMLHTFSFQARPFYEKHGYQMAGELKNFPVGHSQYKMFKDLTVEPHLVK